MTGKGDYTGKATGSFSITAMPKVDISGATASAGDQISGCNKLTTIYADASWALPSSGLTGSQCFYSCNRLVGGNGTAWSSSNTGYMYFRIDTASTPGYVTVA